MLTENQIQSSDAIVTDYGVRADTHPAARYTPLHMPVLSESDKLWGNTLALCRKSLPFEVAGKSYTIDIRMNRPATDRLYPITLALSVASEACFLQLDGWPDDSALRRYVDADILETLPEQLASTVLVSAFNRFFETAERASGARVNLISPRAALPEPDRCDRLDFDLTGPDGVRIEGRLVFDRSLRPFIGAMLRSEDREHSRLDATLSLVLSCRAGSARLTGAEIEHLAPGDIVLVPGRRADSPQPLTLIMGGKPFCRAVYDSGELTIVETQTPTQDAPQATTSGSDALMDGKSLSELEVTLDFDVGELQLTLEAIKNLRPGVVMDLQDSRDNLVKVRNNGSLIATGELVEVEGRIGVRVTRLAN